jgi:solute carrier family 35, member C2
MQLSTPFSLHHGMRVHESCHHDLTGLFLCFVVCRFSFAIILSVYNKWMFSAEHFAFPFPLFVTTMHMFVQFVLATLIRNIWPKRFRPENTPSRMDYA